MLKGDVSYKQQRQIRARRTWDRPPDLFGQLNVVPNSNPLGIKRFVSGISISFKCECNIIMQIQCTKNLNPGRSELGYNIELAE